MCVLFITNHEKYSGFLECAALGESDDDNEEAGGAAGGAAAVVPEEESDTLMDLLMTATCDGRDAGGGGDADAETRAGNEVSVCF